MILKTMTLKTMMPLPTPEPTPAAGAVLPSVSPPLASFSSLSTISLVPSPETLATLADVLLRAL
jgi:hypothetical protein